MTYMPARIGLEPDVRDVLLEQVQDENAALHAENGRLRAENERLRSEGSAKDAESLFELLISKSYTNAAVSILLSVEVLSQKAPVRCLPNACLRRGGALLSPNLFYQPIEIAYSNRL